MNEENIKVGNISLEESNSVIIKNYIFLLSAPVIFIVLACLSINYRNGLFLFLFLLCVFIIIYLIGNRNTLFLPILDNDVFAIHYTTNVDFTEDTADYHEMFDRMKKYYENEPYFEKYEKYKIKKTIFLYNKYAKNKINWVKEQNKKNKLLECKF